MMENLSLVLISYFPCMQGPLYVMTLCHARNVKKTFSVSQWTY